MRRTASEVLRELELRVARLERQASSSSFELDDGTIVVPMGEGHVLISEAVIKHTQMHNETGTGSVFARGIDGKGLVELVEKANVRFDGGVQFFTSKSPRVGYHLVMDIDEALALPNAVLTEAVKEEAGRQIKVPAVKTTAPLRAFSTDLVTLIIGPSSPQFMPQDAKRNESVMEAVNEGLSMSVFTAFPGDPNVPRSSEWNGRFAVIIPV